MFQFSIFNTIYMCGYPVIKLMKMKEYFTFQVHNKTKFLIGYSPKKLIYLSVKRVLS